MTSVVQTALGDRFGELHPKVQWRFGLSSADDRCQYGIGVMEEMTHSKLVPPPVLMVGGRRGLFPAGTGIDVPFTIANYAYVDEFGRETMSFVRRFQFVGKEQGMNSVMVTPAHGGESIDYLGFASDMAVRTACEVDDGGLVLKSGPPRFLLGQPRAHAAAARVGNHDGPRVVGRGDAAPPHRHRGHLPGHRQTLPLPRLVHGRGTTLRAGRHPARGAS